MALVIEDTGGKVVATHHVVLEFGRPIVTQSIFRAEAKHPSAGRLINRHARDRHTHKRRLDTRVRPGGAKFAVDEPPRIHEPAEPRCERRNPIAARLGAESPKANGLPYARPRQLPFHTEHVPADLVIVPDLTAAEKADVGILAAKGADVNTRVEPTPVIIGNRWRTPIRTRGVGGLGYTWSRDQRHRNDATLEEPVHQHDTPNESCTGTKHQ